MPWQRRVILELVMTAYCRIHGSGQGPEGWKLLVHELEQRGHTVLTPALEVNRTDQGLIWHAETIETAIARIRQTCQIPLPAETIAFARTYIVWVFRGPVVREAVGRVAEASAVWSRAR